MSWLRTLRPASFRGVQFGVFLAGKDFGRRVITHVFPQRDKPFHEDMGAHPRAFTIDAFIVGADVQAKAKRLEAALEAKGAGRLVHPYYGSINVVALRSATVFAAFEGRVARVSIAFEEAGTASAPTGFLNTLASLLSSSGLVSSSILDAASSALALADQAMHIREAFAGDLASLAGVLTSTISAFGLSPSVSSIGSVVSVPGARPITVPSALERLASTTGDTIGGGATPLRLVQSTVHALALAPAALKTFSDEKDDAVRVLDAVLSVAGVVPAGAGSADVVANREALSLLVDASAAGAAVEAAAPVVWDILAGHCHGLMLDPTMTRPTLDKSLAALAAELRDLDRKGRMAALQAASARSAARDEDRSDDPVSRELAAHRRTEAAAHHARKLALGSIRSRLETIRAVLDWDDIAWSSERATYRDTLADLHAAERREVAPAPVSPTPEPAPPPVPVGPTADTLLSVVAAPIVKARREALEQGGETSSRYGKRVQEALAAFIEIVGDKPLRDYLPADVQEFANVLARVPSNRHKLKAFAGLTARKAADANDRLPPDQRRPRLSSSAVKTYIADFRPTWRAVGATVPGLRDLTFKVTAPRGAAPAVAREGLSVEAVNAWLADAATHADPHFRWLPLLGLFTGMRMSELVYMQGRDIRVIDGNTVIDLRNPVLVSDVERARPLKTSTSSRIVALHPIFHELGFVAWAQAIEGYLFPDFHNSKDPGDTAQKRMGYWMGRLGIQVRQKGVFHSLRHNAKAWLRPHVGERTADFQCGHAPSSVGARYGFRTLTADEVEMIERAPAPRGIDFSPYREPPSRPMPKAKEPRPKPRFRDVPNLVELRSRTSAKSKRGRGVTA